MARKVIFDKKNVVVIGGAGFVGSHVCDELIKHAKVICIDNYASGSVENISHLLQDPNFIFLRHDITEPIDLDRFTELDIFEVEFQGVQEVYYLACPTIQLGYEEFMVATAKANSIGVMHALDMARRYEAKFLFTSTDSVYGDPLEGQDAFLEDYWGFVNFHGERAAYNEGKRFAETLVQTWHKTYSMDTKVARVFNVYGPRMRLNSGRMIPDFVQAAVDRRDVVIYGDGTTEDTYCYVSDVVQGLLSLMQSAVNEPVNIGNPQMYPIITLAQKIIALAGSKSNIVFEEPIAGLMKNAMPDIAKAKQLIGWFPIVDIDTGLRATVEDMLGSKVLTYNSFTGKSPQQ